MEPRADRRNADPLDARRQLARTGKHVASLFCQQVAPELPEGRSWDASREEVADLMIATVDRYAPGFKASVIARQKPAPLDLEGDFGLIGGDIFHGATALDQFSPPGRCWAMRIIADPLPDSIFAVPAPIPAAASPVPGS